MLNDDQKLFYRNLYRLLNDPKAEELLRTYALMHLDPAIKKVRSKTDEYDRAYNNGVADTWSHIIELKKHLTKIMQEIG